MKGAWSDAKECRDRALLALFGEMDVETGRALWRMVGRRQKQMRDIERAGLGVEAGARAGVK